MTDFPIVRVEVKTYHVYKSCPECSNVSAYGCLLKYKCINYEHGTYLHTCEKCKKDFNLFDKHPLIVQKEMQENQNESI